MRIYKQNIQEIGNKILFFFLRNIFLWLLAVVALSAMFPRDASASCTCCSCVCLPPYYCCDTGSVSSYISQAFSDFQNKFVMDEYYNKTYKKKGLQAQADQFRDIALNSALLIGVFIDGTAMNYSLNKMNAAKSRTLRDYNVSEEVCKFGTLSRSLAASDVKVAANQAALSAIMLTRSMGGIGGIAEAGTGDDIRKRADYVATKTCNPSDNDNSMSAICLPANDPGLKPQNYDADMDYTLAVESKPSLNVDFTSGTRTEEEDAIIALSYNLYGHKLLMKAIENEEAQREMALETNSKTRLVVARRNAAANSFAVIVGMKASGSGGSDAYMLGALQNLGLSSADATAFAGAGHFSYFAQMEMLSKKLYQTPSFYANLMNSPANVRRVTAAMEAVDLAQTRDLYNSTIRSEALMAILLDLTATHQELPRIKSKYTQ